MGNRKKDKAGDDKKKSKQQKPRGTARHRASLDEVREKKLARILKSNGPEEAQKWAEQHGALSILRKMSRERSGKIFDLANCACEK